MKPMSGARQRRLIVTLVGIVSYTRPPSPTFASGVPKRPSRGPSLGCRWIRSCTFRGDGCWNDLPLPPSHGGSTKIGVAMDDGVVDLAGKVALVTGAGRGLGRQYALSLADWGANVAVVGRTRSFVDETVQMIHNAGGAAAGFEVDVAEPGSAVRVLKDVEGSLGSVGVLINNAGTMHLGRLADIDRADWWSDFEVNVRGTMEWCQATLSSMTERRDGLIVNVSSSAAHWTLTAASAYIASKAAVIAMSRVLAAELRNSGVRVFAFGPTARTEMFDGLATSPAFTARQREIFATPDDAEAARRLEGSIRMLRQIIVGDLDEHIGGFLDSEAPPT